MAKLVLLLDCFPGNRDSARGKFINQRSRVNLVPLGTEKQITDQLKQIKENLPLPKKNTKTTIAQNKIRQGDYALGNLNQSRTECRRTSHFLHQFILPKMMNELLQCIPN